jgi:cytochrome c oxidase subunit 2
MVRTPIGQGPDDDRHRGAAIGGRGDRVERALSGGTPGGASALRAVQPIRDEGLKGMGLVRGVGMTGWAGRSRMALAALALTMAGAPLAKAEQALPWEMAMQPAASIVREHIDALHDELLVIITLIVLFVLALLIYVIVKFNHKAHPTPTRTSHNTAIEVAWTVLPILILVVIAFPSFKLLYFNDKTQHAEMTLKVTGHQWYWSYEYPDYKTQNSDYQGPDGSDIGFDSRMIPEADAVKEGKKRLLDVDKPVVLPVGTNVRILVQGSDVIHSWFLPSMGVQEYAVVGRTNESWVNIVRAGTYYGQCNQICGVDHPFMPIEIQAVSKEDFAKWVKDPTIKFEDGHAIADAHEPAAVRVAADAAH